MKIIQAVPTNIITGALGAGKTTLIQKLLESKPAHEPWAILVNEFGEIGIDAALLKSSASGADKSVFIREVPGGCMCCTSGLPMHIALNQLLAQARPKRLLIEPTGLGHPKEVIETLSAEHYQDVINLQSVLCVVDARKLKDKRWREHETFKEQFAVADYAVASKADLYADDDLAGLQQYLNEIGCAQLQTRVANMGAIDQKLLLAPETNNPNPAFNKPVLGMSPVKQARSQISDEQTEVPDKLEQSIHKRAQGEGFFSEGWMWPADVVFDHERLRQLLSALELTRAKGVVITTTGVFAINVCDGEAALQQRDEAVDSRLEIIADSKMKADLAFEQLEDLALSSKAMHG